MFFNSIKEINRVISKRMSNIYLKATQNVHFKVLKSSSELSGQFFETSNLRRYHWIFKLLVSTLKSEVLDCLGWNCVWVSYYSYFERNYDVLKSKSPCFLLNKNIKFNKNDTELIMENPIHNFRDINHVLQLLLELGIKSKIVMSRRSR